MKKALPCILIITSLFICSIPALAQCDISEVSTAQGQNIFYSCPGQGLVTSVELTHETFANAIYTYILTDTDEMIIEILGTMTSLDLAVLEQGTYFVYGLSYLDNLVAQPGTNLFTTPLASGCAVISSAPLIIQHHAPEGGSISTPLGGDVIEIPVGGDPVLVDLVHETTSPANSAFIMTDVDGNIMEVVEGDQHDLSQMGLITAHIYAVSYTGTLDAPPGTTIQDAILSNDCFELSTNHITFTGLPVGVHVMARERLGIAPSPAAEMIMIQGNDKPSPGDRIEILDMQGRQLQHLTWAGGEQQILDVSALAPGQYICRITSREGILTGRFQKE